MPPAQPDKHRTRYTSPRLGNADSYPLATARGRTGASEENQTTTILSRRMTTSSAAVDRIRRACCVYDILALPLAGEWLAWLSGTAVPVLCLSRCAVAVGTTPTSSCNSSCRISAPLWNYACSVARNLGGRVLSAGNLPIEDTPRISIFCTQCM